MYETAVMTSLLMTMKLQGLTSLCIRDLVKMSSNSVTSEDIIQMGKEIIQSLTWNRQIPTAARFAHALVQLLPESTPVQTKMSIYENAVYQIELSIQDELCSMQCASLVAWMSFENAMSDACIPPKTKASVRSTIARITGHIYDMSLRRRLQSCQQTSTPIVEDGDGDDVAVFALLQPTNIQPRELKNINIISQDDMMNKTMPKDIAVVKRVRKESNGIKAPTLRRTKRRRVL
eukprot:CAMPEP_0197260318 /NCGR_PEP_ID=MMETSP1429-20130617/83973_1 /TAXON_ID=49237 /ORGANISM="Chaetoceros  sp., Strain UNC1202" /LENGTH=232 /DNA_ID=CAMNT_0042724557 /DNA_START=1 /DNA_END=699 /DNA_ORIENTATION=+